VTTTSGIHAVQMSEYCIAMMLTFNYKIPVVLQLQAKAEWPKKTQDIFFPNTLRGQTLGIAGYGSIGRELGPWGLHSFTGVKHITLRQGHPQ